MRACPVSAAAARHAAVRRNTSGLWRGLEGSGLRPAGLVEAHADDDERGYVDLVWPWVPVQSSRCGEPSSGACARR